MSNAAKIGLWLGGVLLGLSILTTNVIVVLKVLGGNTPTPVVPVPGQSLAAIVTDAKDRANLAAFYRDFADVIQRDTTGLVKTTGQFRTAHSNAAKLLLQGTPYQRYPDLDKTISARITAAIGLNDAAIDAAMRAKLVAELTAISKDLGG